MRCSWCGGEILEYECYEAPEQRNELIDNIIDSMDGRFYCSPTCLRKNLQVTVSDLLVNKR